MTKKERDELIYARYQDGYSQEEIGKFYGLSQSRISAIILRKKRGLPDREVETRGSKARLSKADLIKLGDLLKKPVEGSDFVHWNKWSVKQLIKDKFGVAYHQNYIWKLMKKIGYTTQRPQRKDYRQNPQKVQDFKKAGAGAIKKKH